MCLNKTLLPKMWILIAVLLPSVCCAQSSSERKGLRETIATFQRILEQADDQFADKAKNVFASEMVDELSRKIVEIRKLTRGLEVSDIVIENGIGRFVYEVPGRKVVTVEFGLTKENPKRIVSVSATTGSPERANLPSLTWETLDHAFAEAVEQGFSGAVLLTRNGKVAFHRAYGLANREKNIKNSPETVFAIGSAPIDFTHAALLLLKDQGKISFGDPIGKYFKHVPTDKAAITIQHLMTGRSGLQDFHDEPSDKEPDHSWIERAEAVRRILNQKLLFEPGAKERHSHSAWGLLAAIVEIASGETYQDFTRERLFKPAGMTDTGFFGDDVAEDKIAVGYGFRKSTEPNSPAHWGKTSWLVMGSGGQVSTLPDLYRWELAIRDGKILSPESTKAFLGGGDRVSADGDMYGFEFFHSHNPNAMFMLISNSIASKQDRQRFDQLGRRLYELVRKAKNTGQAPGQAKYTIGLSMAIEEEDDVERVRVQQITEGGAASKAGIKPGDILLSINGGEIGDPSSTLLPLVASGKSFELVVERGGKKHKLVVSPEPRN